MKSTSNEIRGFRFSSVPAGIKASAPDRLDFGLIVADVPAITAGVTTTNLVCAAPAAITKERLGIGECQAVLANSGNANAYTGEIGRRDAIELTGEAARVLGIAPELVVPMSTGVIGTHLPVTRMRTRIPDLVDGLHESRFLDFARAIMTTDTRPKTVRLDGDLSHCPVRIRGVAKGSGMIAPKMATMLAVILVDVRVELAFLRECLIEANSTSFDCITIDGDTSTNDTLLVMAGGHTDAPDLGGGQTDRIRFSKMLVQACGDLARQIVMDGEGATKLVEIRVTGARNTEDASRVARTIAESLLVKTAFAGEDPNWGRIIAAAGRAGVGFNPDRVDLSIGNVSVVSEGKLASGDWEPRAAQVMKQREFSIVLNLRSGSADAAFLTSDLSEEYVRINADYRT